MTRMLEYIGASLFAGLFGYGIGGLIYYVFHGGDMPTWKWNIFNYFVGFAVSLIYCFIYD